MTEHEKAELVEMIRKLISLGRGMNVLEWAEDYAEDLFDACDKLLNEEESQTL